MSLSRNQIALAGEFAVLSQLALQGFDANLTLGNTKGVDILVSIPDTDIMRRIEVKTHSHNKPYQNKTFGHIVGQWQMSQKHETNRDPSLLYCFVSIANQTNQFEFYVVPSSIVADFVTTSHSHWLSRDPSRKDTDRRSFMLGTTESQYEIETPKAEDYLNRWDLLKV